MGSLIETGATIIILIFAILLLTHLLNGTATKWVSSKFSVA